MPELPSARSESIARISLRWQMLAEPRVLAGLSLFFTFGGATNIQFNNFLFESRGLTPMQIGYAGAAGTLTAFFSPLLAGILVDRSATPRRIVNVYMACGAVGLLVFPWLHGFAALLLGFFLLQVFLQAVSPVMNSMILGGAGTRGQSSFLAIRAMGTLGFAIVSLFFTGWLTADRLPGAYALMAVCMLAGMAFFNRLPDPPPSAPDKPRVSLREALSLLWRRDLIVVYGAFGLGYLSTAMGFLVFPVHIVRELGGSAKDISRAWTLSTFIELGIMFAAIPVIRRFGFRILIGVSFASVVARWLWLASTGSLFQLYLSQALHGLLVTGVYTGQTLLLARMLPSDRRASGIAAASIVNAGLMGTMGNLLGGWIWETYSIRAVFLAAALVAFVAGGLNLAFGPRLREDVEAA